MTIREKILAILNDLKPSLSLENVSNIVEGGYLNSMELMALITELMENFELEIDFEAITPQNFNSVDAIASLVEQMQQ